LIFDRFSVIAASRSNRARGRASKAAMVRLDEGGGYSDQAHFTRDARALLGESPMSWFGRGADSFKTLR